MKKLMVLAAAMIVAAATQAAAVYWTANNVYAGNATDKNTGIAYFMVTSMAETSAFTIGGLTHADVTSLIGSAYGWTPTTAGTYSKASTAPVANAALGLVDETNYTAYLVVFDGATIDTSTAYLVSPTKDFKTYTGTSNANVGIFSMSTASKDAGNWTNIVPEPTSGLMLLVGLAGLALKRKVA